MFENKLSFDEALEAILETCTPLATEEIEVTDALGRVPADKVVAERSVPGFRNAKMDGFAARLEDVQKALEEYIPINGEIAAGDTDPPEVPAGSAVRIMTGAPVPEKLDCVVKIEDCAVRKNKVKFNKLRQPEPGLNVRSPGDDLERGETVIKPGVSIGPAGVGSLILSGRKTLEVYKRPRVLIFSSGDELVEQPGADLVPGEIYDINNHTVAAVAASSGARVNPGGVLPDSRNRAVKKIKNSDQDWDVLVTSGGVSKGEHDLTADMVEAIGGEIIFHGVSQKPGKPLAFARRGEQIILMLPGNVVSALVNSYLHLKSALNKLHGKQQPRPEFSPARASRDFPRTGDRLTFFRGKLSEDEAEQVVAPVLKNQGSHVLSSVTRANCLARIEPETKVRSGDTIPVTALGCQTQPNI